MLPYAGVGTILGVLSRVAADSGFLPSSLFYFQYWDGGQLIHDTRNHKRAFLPSIISLYFQIDRRP